jgi:PAS domain-containing protein
MFPDLAFRSTLQLFVTVLIALSFGAGPSLVSALWGALLADYAILSPPFEFSLRTPGDRASIILYAAVGIAISILPSQLARSRRAAELARAEALQARAEAAGRAEQLQTTFDAMGDAALLYDTEKRLLQHNMAHDRMFRFDLIPGFATLPIEARYAQLTVQDREGRPVALDELPHMRALRGEVLTGDHAVDLRMGTLDERTLDVNVTAAPVCDANGRIVGSVAIFRDVTERRRLEQRTEEALTALLEMAQVLVAASPASPPDAETSADGNGGSALAAVH